MPQVEVSFEIDVNGIMSVSALDQATGRSQSMVIHASGGLSQSELGKLVTESRSREQSDKQKKEQEAVVRQLDGLVTNTMRSVQALEGKLTADEQSRILQAMERAKKARTEADLEELKTRLAEMEKAASLIGQRLRPDRFHPGSAARVALRATVLPDPFNVAAPGNPLAADPQSVVVPSAPSSRERFAL